MRAVEYVALGVVAAGLAAGIGLVIAAVPDIARYARMRRM
jgi:hypothetical protein